MRAAVLLWLYDRLIIGLAQLAGLMLLAIAAAIVYDVALRNLGFRPPQAISALTEYALLYVTMAAGPWLVRTGGHVTIRTLTDNLPEGFRAALERVVLGGAILLSLLLAGAALRHGGRELRTW